MTYSIFYWRSTGCRSRLVGMAHWTSVARRFGVGLLLPLAVMSGLVAQEVRPLPPRLAQAVIESPRLVPPAAGISSTQQQTVIEGSVAEVFGNRFVLDLGDERILVEPIDSQAVLSAGRGDKVRVEGQRGGAIFRAGQVLREGKSVLAASPGVPAISPITRSERIGILPVLQNLGLRPIGAPVRKRQHTEILAQMPDGRTVYVSFDRSDRLWEIEDANYDKESAVVRGLARADYIRIASEAGFAPTGGFEQKPRHIELEVTNRQGERLELHIDPAGIIYKQVWLW